MNMLKYTVETRDGKSLHIYGKGVVTKEKIEKEIIPILEKKDIDIPVNICSYFSEQQYPAEYPNLLHNKNYTKLGRPIPARPKKCSKSCEWKLDKERKITKVHSQ